MKDHRSASEIARKIVYYYVNTTKLLPQLSSARVKTPVDKKGFNTSL